jgi:hypothetical protein
MDKQEKLFQFIDWSEIEKMVSRVSGVKLEVRYLKAYVYHPYNPSDNFKAVYDDELVGYESEIVNMVTKDGGLLSEECFSIPFYKVMSGNKKSIMAYALINVPISMVEESLTGDIVDIDEMMGDRRGYNDRLQSNERRFFEHLNGEYHGSI